MHKGDTKPKLTSPVGLPGAKLYLLTMRLGIILDNVGCG